MNWRSIDPLREYEKFIHVKLIFAFLFLISLNSLQGKPPNVVILFTDDQGTIDANCYGSKDLITPNIDRLATTGVLFTQAYAHTVCCPARAALLTGRHPQRGGVWTGQGDMNSPRESIWPLKKLHWQRPLNRPAIRLRSVNGILVRIVITA